MPDGSHANDGPTYPPREFWDRRPVAIDIYNNYITNAHDNSIEMDGSMHNIRLMRNVLINSASHPMSTQPSVGGPIYWIRNIVYHAPGGSTRMTAGLAGRDLLPQHRHHRDQRRVVGELALAQQPDARPEHRAGDLQRQDQHQLQLVGLQRLPSESRATPAFVPMELAAVAGDQSRHGHAGSRARGCRPRSGARCRPRGSRRRCRARRRAARRRQVQSPRWRPASSRPWPTTRRRPARIATASWSTTTCWSTCRSSMPIRRPSSGCTTFVTRLPPASGLGRDRPWRRDPEYQRRLQRQGAGSRRARGRPAAAAVRPAAAAMSGSSVWLNRH